MHTRFEHHIPYMVPILQEKTKSTQKAARTVIVQ